MNAARPLLPALEDAWTARGWDLDDLRHFRMEGDGGDGGTGGAGAGAGAGGGEGESELNFPQGTRLEQMTVEEQLDYWKHQSRKHEKRATVSDDIKARAEQYEGAKSKADQYDELVRSTQSDQEKAIEAARTESAEQGRIAERAAMTPRLVAAEMRAAAGGRIDADRLAAVLEPIDSTKFLTDTGEVDTEKVGAFIAGIAPADDGKGGKPGFPNLGQGRREAGGTPSVATGAERFAERHASRNKTT